MQRNPVGLCRGKRKAHALEQESLAEDNAGSLPPQSALHFATVVPHLGPLSIGDEQDHTAPQSL